MFRKKTPSLGTLKKLQTINSSGTCMNIEEMITLATKKLKPILQVLVEKSDTQEHYLTSRQYDDILIASRVIKDVVKTFQYSDPRTNIKKSEFLLETHRPAFNDKGDIFVDTILLIEILDLHNLLDEIKITMDNLYKSIGTHSFVQTESRLSVKSSKSSNPNKMVFKLNQRWINSNNSLGVLQRDFIVMPSITDISNEESGENALKESQSQNFAETSELAQTPSRKVKSTSSLAHEEIHQVTDVYGAKRAVVRCIYDLQEVSNYLGTERKDVSTICSMVEVDNVPNNTRRSSGSHKNVTLPDATNQESRQRDSYKPESAVDGEGVCCCPECFAKLSGSQTDLDECDDKIIICIKGCNEDEGDVQIVIRQCPDCKKTKGSSSESPTYNHSAEESSTIKSRTDSPHSLPSSKDVSQHKSNLKKIEAEERSTIKSRSDSPHSLPSSKDVSQNKSDLKKIEAEERSTIKSRTDSPYSLPSIKDFPQNRSNLKKSDMSTPDNSVKSGYQPSDKSLEKAAKEVESTTLHNKDSQGSYICSEESDEDKALRDLLQPTPRQSAVSSDREESPDLKQNNYIQNQARVSCSNIHLYETKNLCLQTENGQELVISLTVSPKTYQKPLSLRDIFSEDDYIRSDVGEMPSLPSKETKEDSLKNENTKSKHSDFVVPDPETSPSSYYVEDRVVPLGRTKICSSLEFDVTTAESKIRQKGVQNRNPKIVVQLEDFGVNNLLRACRPAKCCRKAVLNEKMKKCLPYPPSLRSLPLDDDDFEVINESLQMSLQKVKNSMDIQRDFYSNQAYFMNRVHTIMYFFVEKNKPKVPTLPNSDKFLVKQKLSYYINLVNDTEPKSQTYRVLYFDVEPKRKKPDKIQSDQQQEHMHNSQPFDVVKVLSSPIKWMRTKYNKYEDRPMITGQITNSPLNADLTIFKNLTPEIQTKSQNKADISTRKFVSKIPVYQKRHGTSHCKKNPSNLMGIYTASLNSLPKEIANLELLANEKERVADKSIAEEIKMYQDLKHKSSSKSSDSSKSSYKVGRKTRRKKKEFYLSRSKSEVSLTTIKQMVKNKVDTSSSKITEFKKTCTQTDKTKTHPSKSCNEDDDSSKTILKYFTRMLYEMIVKESFKENNEEYLPRYFNEDYLKVSAHNTGLFKTNNSNMKTMHVKQTKQISSYHDLKAKKSQSCIVISRHREKNVYLVKNLSLQTSSVIADNKPCQTSSILLQYSFPHPTRTDNSCFTKKSLYKKFINTETINGISNSCDQIENFLVIFKSDDSLLASNFSHRDFFSTPSNGSLGTAESGTKQSVSQSLLKLKETLEKYEDVKNEIARGSLVETNVNPIEYFVYQMCACNKINKKPSVMKKILSKTKDFFSSIDKDICNKYKNQQDFFKKPSAERQLCHRCGCYIAACNGNNVTSEKNPTVPVVPKLVCQCPPPNEPKTDLTHQPCCKKPKLPKTNTLAKLTTSSVSSLKSLTTCFKNSLANIITRTKNQSLGPCKCDSDILETKNVETICVSENFKVVACTKKDTSTATTKDSGTQKCECQKCENFSEDGSCCCSHCLGCLDKSFNAKPENNNVGIECKQEEDADTQEEKDSNKTKSNEIVSSSINAAEETEKTSSPPQPDNEVEEIPKPEEETTNNDTAAYYFIASSPNMFRDFEFRNRNPFNPCLLQFPQLNMFRVDDQPRFLDE